MLQLYFISYYIIFDDVIFFAMVLRTTLKFNIVNASKKYFCKLPYTTLTSDTCIHPCSSLMSQIEHTTIVILMNCHLYQIFGFFQICLDFIKNLVPISMNSFFKIPFNDVKQRKVTTNQLVFFYLNIINLHYINKGREV